MLTLYFKIALVQLKSEGTKSSVSRIIFRAFLIWEKKKRPELTVVKLQIDSYLISVQIHIEPKSAKAFWQFVLTFLDP